MGVEMATTQDFANWVCGADLIPEFLLYVFRSMSSEFGRLMMGSTHNTIYMPDIQAMKCAIPPFAEQRTIVGFLDRETTKIDALVAEQERLIELLAESRQAVISHAVTTGIDRSAPMKQSGSAFLGDIPSHWQVAKLKHVVPQLTVGIVVEPSKYYEEAGVPALRSLNVRPGRIVLDDLVRISPKSNELHSKSRLFAGDLVSVRSGQPGTTAVIPEHLDGCNCVDLLIIRRPEDSTEEYLCWFLGSIPARAQVIHGTDGAIQQHFNVGTAGNLLVANPPSSEKHRISGWLSQACSRIDELVCECRRATGLLRERRSALISAAVTGQIDVRTAVPAEVA
jgi:type I restriction enzyme S subunit